MEPRDVLDDLARGDLESLRLKLHPYLHWETPDGRTLRGRRSVLAELEGGTPVTEPRAVELREGQIYRWLA